MNYTVYKKNKKIIFICKNVVMFFNFYNSKHLKNTMVYFYTKISNLKNIIESLKIIQLSNLLKEKK